MAVRSTPDAEGKAGVARGIVAGGGEDLRVNHAGTQQFESSARRASG